MKRVCDYMFVCVSGTLSGVTGLIVDYNSPEEFVAHWCAPPSLEGVPILGYTLIVDIMSSLEEVLVSSSKVFLTQTNITVTKPFGVNCTVINITVFAKNIVGLGDPENTIVYFQESKLTL